MPRWYIAPIDDHRASARYRTETAHALLGKALIEAAGTATTRTRVVGQREKVTMLKSIAIA